MNSKPKGKRFPTRMLWMLALAMFALVCGGSVHRINPGGPFFSMSGDVLPTMAAIVVILAGITIFRTGNFLAIALSCILILVACFAITDVVTGVLQFWFHPSARGTLLGS